jgi:glycerate kinase
MESGVDFLLSNMGFEEKIKNAELLITAEGRVDAQTLQGKGPYGVASKARQYGVPTIILAGKAEDIDQLNSGFSAVFSITNGPTTLEHAMKKTARDLGITSTQIGNLLALSKL